MLTFFLAAYKHADGKKIDGRRVLVDVERARTVKGWLPRRLGGGLGGTRRGGPEVNIKHSGREDNERERERYRLEREREAVRDRDRCVLHFLFIFILNSTLCHKGVKLQIIARGYV